jgi:hypothetical protein
MCIYILYIYINYCTLSSTWSIELKKYSVYAKDAHVLVERLISSILCYYSTEANNFGAGFVALHCRTKAEDVLSEISKTRASGSGERTAKIAQEIGCFIRPFSSNIILRSDIRNNARQSW